MAKQDEEFDGFMTRDGELISIRDTDRLSAIFLRTSDVETAVATLWQLATECLGSGYYEAACKYIEKILPLVDTPIEKAECFLRMGTALENMREFAAAEEMYSQAFDLPQEPSSTWYFLNNNRAFCLNQVGLHEKAEKYCRAAIQIEPNWHNAHKNLGVALAQLGRLEEAAQTLIRATKLCPEDPRALSHLDELFAAHREIAEQVPDFPAHLHACHELVQNAHGDLSVQ